VGESRIEAVINDPLTSTFSPGKSISPSSSTRPVSWKTLPMIEPADQGCAIWCARLERIHQPRARVGHRTWASRSGDQRSTALAGAIRTVVHAPAGFTSLSLRGRADRDLCRYDNSLLLRYEQQPLRLHGLIERTPRTGSDVLASEWIRVAVLHSGTPSQLVLIMARS
jgi:hypothetical protein